MQTVTCQDKTGHVVTLPITQITHLHGLMHVRPCVKVSEKPN